MKERARALSPSVRADEARPVDRVHAGAAGHLASSSPSATMPAASPCPGPVFDFVVFLRPGSVLGCLLVLRWGAFWGFAWGRRRRVESGVRHEGRVGDGTRSVLGVERRSRWRASSCPSVGFRAVDWPFGGITLPPECLCSCRLCSMLLGSKERVLVLAESRHRVFGRVVLRDGLRGWFAIVGCGSCRHGTRYVRPEAFFLERGSGAFRVALGGDIRKPFVDVGRLELSVVYDRIR